MKKRMIIFITAILLVCFTAGTVLTADSAPYDNDVQSQFLKLQMELAEEARRQASDKLEQIKKMQEERKLVANLLNIARERRNAAESKNTTVEMPSDMAEYMKANNLSYDTTGGDLLLNKDQWEHVIRSLESRLDTLGSDIQQKMFSVQDFLSQYNSYQQIAPVPDPNQMGISRGQSMYGDSEVGLAVTGLVVGIVLGCLITLVVQKSREKKDKA